jgi:DNA helicase-2/ATP-dependent DNA helicase PcrA
MTTFSPYQTAIFDFVAKDRGHGAVNAVAGSGKTFTSCESTRRIPNAYSVLFTAFGRDIADELRKRQLGANVRIATYNSFCWDIARRSNPNSKLILDNDKNYKTLQFAILQTNPNDEEGWKRFLRLRGPIDRLIRLMKARCVFSRQEIPAAMEELVLDHAIEIPSEEQDFPAILASTYERVINNKVIYDYDDQIFQVLYQDMLVPASDYVFVDEFQDTNEMQAQVMQKAARNGRFIGVGDPDQAIYGFRGATPDAFAKFIKDFNAKELPLSICYRCPKAVVELAQSIVPRIEYAPWAEDGHVEYISTEQFLRTVKPGDFVLCRTVAPLVKRCLACIRDGVPARVLGREIGQDLKYMIDKVSEYNYTMSIPEFVNALGSYIDKRMATYAACQNSSLAIALDDKHQTIVALLDGLKTVSDLMLKIDVVFHADKVNNCILFMSGHKSKGLECDNKVFILRPDLLPHPKAKTERQQAEELRLKYVMITRTKQGLYFVEKEVGEK